MVSEMSLSPEAVFSTTVLTVCLLLAGLMYWLEKRPRVDLRPRLFPTTLVMFASILLALGAALHLLNLAGIHIPQR